MLTTTAHWCPQSKLSLPLLPIRSHSSRILPIRASYSSENAPPTTSTETKSPFLEIPKHIWRQTLQPLSDFGFGQRSIWEGGVGLFMVTGAAVFTFAILWIRGFQIRSRFRKYQAVFEFTQACGICVGTPVRIRGVTVGNVVRVNSSLRCIEAVVEVQDEKIIVPRNALVEVNQSGLLMETLIDITPQEPLPSPSASPLSPDCSQEGLIVCDKEKIKGEQGVSLDGLVGVWTRLGREMDEIGVSRGYQLAEKVASVVEEAQPLLAKIEALAENFQPLLSEIKDSSLLKDVESLTKSLAEATEGLSKVQGALLTPENAELIRQSIYTLIYTLKNVESISSDISGFTGDEVTRRNLKLLIKSLSRLL